jgi:carbamoyl-phosphate synthase small subunit
VDEGSWELGKGHGQPGPARFHVVAYDFGVKRNILRMLVDRGCRVTVVPAQTPAAEVLALKPDGVFLSNGPGDPEPCDYAIARDPRDPRAGVPVFGICLGHQLLGLASGAKTLKMKFGHHGANHPVQDLDTGTVMITSQNHGFAVDEATLPPNCAPRTARCSTARCRASRAPTAGVQLPGPPGSEPRAARCRATLFDRFVELME